MGTKTIQPASDREGLKGRFEGTKEGYPPFPGALDLLLEYCHHLQPNSKPESMGVVRWCLLFRDSGTTDVSNNSFASRPSFPS